MAQRKVSPTGIEVLDLVKRFQLLVGYPLPGYAAETKAAKWLLQHSYTWEQIEGCWRYQAADPFWKGKHVGLPIVAKHIGAWLKAGSPSPEERNHGKEWTKPASDEAYLAALRRRFQ